MGSKKKIIAFSLLGDITKNSRALRQIDALTNRGFDVQAIGFSRDLKHAKANGPSSFTHLPYPKLTGPRLFWRAHRLLESVLTNIDADIYHASDLYSLPASRIAAKYRKASFTFDSRELYSRVQSVERNRLKKRVWSQIERYYLPQCNRIFTVSDSIADFLAENYSISRPIVIRNSPDISAQIKSDLNLRELVGPVKGLLVLHNGQVRPGRGCESLAAAFEHLVDSRLVFMGDGPSKTNIIDRAHQNGYRERIHFVDPVAPNQVVSATSTADLGVTMLEDSCLNHRFALPNKLFEYCAAGIPVLGSALPELTKIISDHNVGTVADPQNVQSIVDTILHLDKNRDVLLAWKQQTGQFSETFSWKNASEIFVKAFEQLETRRA